MDIILKYNNYSQFYTTIFIIMFMLTKKMVTSFYHLSYAYNDNVKEKCWIKINYKI